MDNSDLAVRMKKYEHASRHFLTRRTPVIIRLDGKAFHSFTKGFVRPFDDLLIQTMQETTKYLCENIQGCVLGYTQSDEITLVLVDYKNINSEAWFENNIQKMCSISASMATMAFNLEFERALRNLNFDLSVTNDEGLHSSILAYEKVNNSAMFDSRVFIIPKEEVTNNFIWRQQDATRNSVQMVGQAYFSHKELEKKTCDKIQDMLMVEKGINWNDFPIYQRRGSCCIKESYMKKDVMRNRWIIDKEIPIFTKDRDYIEKLINSDES